MKRWVKKPWGTYKVIGQGKNFKVKTIKIKPHSRTSLQRHQYRDEIWVNVNKISLKRTYFIQKGTLHRLTNKSDKPLTFIEVQIGEKLLESDIIREEDDYGRA